MEQENKLIQVVRESGLEPNKVDELMKNFSLFFGQAKDLADDAKAIEVTDESQVSLMKLAREKRLALREVRINVEKTRVALKEQSKREGQAIDGASNIIKAIIIPIEERLEKMEKFAETKKAERVEKRLNDRMEALMPYVDSVSVYNLREMDDVVFANLLESSKLAFEATKQAQAKAEADRLAKEKADKEEQEKIRKENEELKKQAEEAEKKRADEKKKQDAEMEKERAERQKILDEEKKKREELEAQMKAKEEADKKAKDEADAKIRAEEEIRRKALLAPDKEKLIELASKIALVEMPNVESAVAGNVINEVEVMLLKVTNYITEQSKKL